MKNILMVLLVRLQIGYSSAIMRVYLLKLGLVSLKGEVLWIALSGRNVLLKVSLFG